MLTAADSRVEHHSTATLRQRKSLLWDLRVKAKPMSSPNAYNKYVCPPQRTIHFHSCLSVKNLRQPKLYAFNKIELPILKRLLQKIFLHFTH